MKIAAPPLILNEPPAHTCNGGMKKCDRGAEGLRSARVLHAGGGRRAGRVGFKMRTQMRRGDASCGAVCRLGAYLAAFGARRAWNAARGVAAAGG